MSSPTKEESDPADNALKNSENEAPNDCSTAIEPSFAESSMISQVESNPMNRELDIPTSQEHAILQPAEENELEVEKKPRNPQEDIKEEESLLHRVPIPRKLISLMSGLRKLTHLNVPLAKINRINPLTNRTRFHVEKNQKTNDICYVNVHYKIPFQFSISWRIPFINRYERRRMILHQLCERHLPQITMCVQQKYVTHIIRPNVLNQRVRLIIFGRPLRVYYYYPLSKRIALKMRSKSNDIKRNEELHIFVRPALDASRTQTENKLTRQALDDDPLRSHHYMRAVIITTDDGWKYLCPICGTIFNTLLEFRQHSCNFSGN